MPTYCYQCICGCKEEVARAMEDVQSPYKCPECGDCMVRDYRAESPNIGDKEYARPIVSDSLAIMPSQVEEHKRLHPDIKLDSECRPIFDSYRSHQKYLDDCGFQKQRQRIRRKKRKKLA